MKSPQALGACCIVLAAGESSRMGRPKQLLELDGKPLFTYALNTALEVCEEVVLVQGAVDLSGYLPPAGNLKLLTNRDWHRGMLGSLQTGLARCRHTRIFVIPADLPMVQAATYRHLAGAQGTAPAAFPVCNGRRGHPVLLGPEAVSLINAADPELKAMKVIAPLDPLAVEVTDSGIYRDIDTPEEWERLKGE
ncbi:nucleotidyltransferase family protein [Marispirochaeta aestuarii]|uniref:nucleotidyltransferase family protein n=1 Tax=Marispirochaeta aestuarii TaxID=1963862 RepID=UPI0029C66181|nr:nucleotidyltransferase family protein [Marispirochaeta aestuarii]